MSLPLRIDYPNKSILVDADSYVLQLVRYIHLNPHLAAKRLFPGSKIDFSKRKSIRKFRRQRGLRPIWIGSYLRWAGVTRQGPPLFIIKES